MCNPAIAAIGAMAIGTGLQMRAQTNQDKARAETMKLERQRQEAYSKEAQDKFAKQLADYSGTARKADTKKVQAETDARNAEATADYTAGELGPSATVNVGAGTSDAIRDQIVRGLSEGQDRASRQSAFEAFGQASTDFDRSLRKTNSDLGNLAGYSAGSASVLPYELAAANTKGQRLATLGQLFGSIGSMTAMYGANQAAPVAGAAGAGNNAAAASAFRFGP